MKTSLIFALAFAQAVFGAANVAKRAGSCAADNCARAVTGTRKGTAGLVTATSDCRSFVAQTVASLQVVPTYATACSGTVRYSSACSCLGITSASVRSKL